MLPFSGVALNLAFTVVFDEATDTDGEVAHEVRPRPDVVERRLDVGAVMEDAERVEAVVVDGEDLRLVEEAPQRLQGLEPRVETIPNLSSRSQISFCQSSQNSS